MSQINLYVNEDSVREQVICYLTGSDSTFIPYKWAIIPKENDELTLGGKPSSGRRYVAVVRTKDPKTFVRIINDFTKESTERNIQSVGVVVPVWCAPYHQELYSKALKHRCKVYTYIRFTDNDLLKILASPSCLDKVIKTLSPNSVVEVQDEDSSNSIIIEDDECINLFALFEQIPKSWDDFSAIVSRNALLPVNEIDFDQKHIYPIPEYVFRIFHLVNPKDIKVIIIGQDPYHNPGEAQGIAFSVPDKLKTPPSLRNILKKVENSGYDVNGTDLIQWVEQGVFLINTALTVTNKPEAHLKLWEPFTKALFKWLNNELEHCVVIGWGAKARKLAQAYFDASKHKHLYSSHPSPLGHDTTTKAAISFKDNDHFCETNTYLKQWGYREIDWTVNPTE